MYNKTIMIGNLTKDIELKYLPSGSAIAKTSIANTNKYKDKQGNQKEEVCFIDITVFGKQAEIFNQYLKKGSKIMLDGKLVFEQWKAQDGTNRSRHTLKVESFEFLDKRQDGGQQPQPQGYSQQVHQQVQQVKQQVQQQIPTINVDEEIPF